MSSPLLMRHLSGEPTGRFPVWVMRQAGRYLPEYRALREKHGFWESVTTPELAVEITLMPIRRYPLDGAILFSDILTLPYGLGIPIELKESVGPVTTTALRTQAAFEVFSAYESSKHTPYVDSALRLLRQQLPADVALLGFAGAPWTVGTYLIEGKPSKNFEHVKKWAFQDPQSLQNSLRKLAHATVRYLQAQVDSGAHAVQVFDTWVGEVPRTFFPRYLNILSEMFSQIRKVPVIYYTRASALRLRDFAELPVDVLSVDASIRLSEAKSLIGGQKCLQGNLDPVLLLTADAPLVRRETRQLVNEAQTLQQPTILNLGHGVLPGTPLENVQAFIEEARSPWI